MRCLIWDFDGTLGYRDGMWSQTLVEVLAQEAPDRGVTVEEVRAHLRGGFPWDTPNIPHPQLASADAWWRSMERVLTGAVLALGFGPRSAQECAARFRHHYCDLARWRCYDDTLPALQQLADRGWKHVILSNHVPELGAILAHLGLGAFILKLFNSAETGYEKPHPLAFQAVLDYIGPTEKLWMIGDNLTADIAGAARMGIPGILVRHYREGAPRFCSDLSGILTLLE